MKFPYLKIIVFWKRKMLITAQWVVFIVKKNTLISVKVYIYEILLRFYF